MSGSTSLPPGEAAPLAVAESQGADRLPYEPSAQMQGGMDRAGETAGHWVVFPSPPLVASAIAGPVPDGPPASLADVVESVTDDDGRLVDWVVDPDSAYDAGGLKAYHEWRSSWVRTWDLGSFANLRSLHRLVAGLPDVSRVAALFDELASHPEAARIERSAIADLLTELDTVRAAIAGGGREGTAVVDQTPRRQSTVGFSRTWTTPSEPELLSANTSTGVMVDPVLGLVVLDQATGRRIVDVVETDLRGETVVVTNRAGDTLEFAAGAARPLAWIVPTSVLWTVRPIPEVVVWSALFSRLPDALRFAATTETDISFSVDRDS